MYNKIALISDLHLDSWAGDTASRINLCNGLFDRCLERDVDLIVLAGDLSNGSSDKQYVSAARDIPVVVVTGNHDYYGKSLPAVPDFLIHEQYVCTTLWTGFHNCVKLSPNIVFNHIADNFYIRGASVERLVELFEMSWEEIKNLNKEIVVTHFPPFQESIAPQYKDDPMNPYFINDMGKMFNEAKLKTKLWLCGHTHYAHSYYKGDMLVACNPCGYRGENYRRFDDYQPLIIEKHDDIWNIV